VPGGSGDITDVNTPGGGGLQGGTNLGPANLRLIDCGANQILKYISAAWQCAADDNGVGVFLPLGGGTLTGGLTGTTAAFSGQGSFTAVPTGALVNQGPLYVNPASAASGSTLLGVAVGGIQRFLVDAEGDVTGNMGSFTTSLTAPTGTFTNRLIARTTLEAAALGSATSGTGFNSASQVFLYSVHNGTAALTQEFRWLAEPQNNGTAGAAGRMKLLWGNGVTAAADTGLSIANDGIITFAAGQTFPGGGGGGVTQVNSGAGLTGGPITSTGTLAVDFTQTQARVAGSCAAGSSIRVIAQDGSVTCETDDGGAGGGTVTQVNTGLGLTGGPITTSGTVSIDTTVVPQLGSSNMFAASNIFAASSASPIVDVTQNGGGNAISAIYTGSTPSTAALRANATSTSGNQSFGLQGLTQSAHAGAAGVRGEAQNAAGAGGVGVHGIANSPSGIGVQGSGNTGVIGSGSFVGVFGSTSHASGPGGRFQNTGTGPILQGLNSSGTMVFNVAGSGAVTGNGFFQSNGRIAGLLPNCTGSQIMKMNPGGTDWQCDSDQGGGGGGSGDITDVFGGTGISVNNPGGPQPTVNIDTAVVPTLNGANSFIGANTFNGASTFNSGVTIGNANLTVDSNTLFVDATNNRVGIGTTSPAKELHIVGGANTGLTLESSTSNGNPTLTVKANSPAGHAAVVIDRADTGAPAQLVFNTGGVNNWRLWTPVGVPDRLDIANGSSAPVMTFTQSGLIGIGTTTPGHPLTVGGIIMSTSGGFRFPDGTTQITAATGGGSGTVTSIAAGTGLTASPGSPITTSGTLSIDTTIVPRMNVVNTFTANQLFNANVTVDGNTLFVDSANNRVGVGTNAPSFKLHVINDAPSVVPFSVRAIAGQTAPLALWQDSTSQFLAAITVDGHLSTLGVLDVGSWAGTDETPNVTEPATGTANVFEGLVVRRINTSITTAGIVVAATDALELERDGTVGGFVIRLTNNARQQNAFCTGMTSAGTFTASVNLIPGSVLQTYSLFGNSLNVIYAQCLMGNGPDQGHHTQFTMMRSSISSGVWIGSITSTFNQ
jgi:hypothetical protein